MTDLFTELDDIDARIESARVRDCLRHAAEWERMAQEQPNTPRGRAFALEASATAEHFRKESFSPKDNPTLENQPIADLFSEKSVN